jgi:MFS family permease
MEKTTVIDSHPDVERPTAWRGALLPDERHVLKASWSGWVLDGMDTQMYSFVIPTLIAMWGISRAQAGAIGTTMLMTSAVGGWIAGYLSDRIGRVRTLQLTILWFAFFSFISGIVQNFDQLIVARGLMGLGFGGEYAAGAVLLSESVRQSMRGKAIGVNATGFAVGWGAAAILFTVVFSILKPALAWRVLFIFGVLPALLVIYVRRYVKEPEVYRNAIANDSHAKHGPFEIFKPSLLRPTVICSILSTGSQGAYFAISSWLPAFLSHERGLNVAGTGAYVLVTVAGSFFGYLVAAWLSDRVGRRGSIAIFGVCSIIMTLLYTLVPANDLLLLVLGFPLGFFAAGALSVLPALYTETFPTYCRGLSLGFVHNFGRATGSLLPFLVGVFSQRVGLGISFGAFAAGGFTLMVISALCLPETRDRGLKS